MNSDENQEIPASSAHSGDSDRGRSSRTGKEVDRLVGVNGENKFKDSLRDKLRRRLRRAGAWPLVVNDPPR